MSTQAAYRARHEGTEANLVVSTLRRTGALKTHVLEPSDLESLSEKGMTYLYLLYCIQVQRNCSKRQISGIKIFPCVSVLWHSPDLGILAGQCVVTQPKTLCSLLCQRVVTCWCHCVAISS